MALKNIAHYLLRANDLEVSKQFYTEVLGLTVGYRPPFPFPGYWLYLQGVPVVHMVEAYNANKAQQKYLSSNDDVPAGISAIDHVAFSADNFEQMVKHLLKFKIPIQHRIVPEEENADQLFIVDPNGLRIELNFS